MSDWNSTQYLKFKNERTQPAVDLAMRIKNNPKTIVDIGCGPGNSTSVLRDIFPYADILGIDNSPNMIEKAKAEHPDISFRLCDALSLDGKYDLLFSNACLQWIPDHETLIPSLRAKEKGNRRTQEKRRKRHNTQRGDHKRSPLKNCVGGSKEKPNRLKSS